VALGLRINEFRNSFTLPADIKWPNIESKGQASATATDDDGASYGTSIATSRASWTRERLIPMKDTELNWDNVIPWLRANTRLPIWLKGGKLLDLNDAG
jgi:(S)-2-hydroxy-acid oxidase